MTRSSASLLCALCASSPCNPAVLRPDLVPDGHALHPVGGAARHHRRGRPSSRPDELRRRVQGARRGHRRVRRRRARPRTPKTRRRRRVASVKLKVRSPPTPRLGVREFRIATRLGRLVARPARRRRRPGRGREAGATTPPPRPSRCRCPASSAAGSRRPRTSITTGSTAKAGQVLTFEVFCARIQDKIHDLQKHADPLVRSSTPTAGNWPPPTTTSSPTRC